jgi:hypothetical protein
LCGKRGEAGPEAAAAESYPYVLSLVEGCEAVTGGQRVIVPHRIRVTGQIDIQIVKRLSSRITEDRRKLNTLRLWVRELVRQGIGGYLKRNPVGVGQIVIFIDLTVRT